MHERALLLRDKIFYAICDIFLLVKNNSKTCAIKKNMRNFSILNVDDDYSLKQHASVGLRLDPLSVSPNRSGVTTTPLDGVTVLLTKTQIF
jgi:hypothetical protein